jgi:LacI family transcriptional regulator
VKPTLNEIAAAAGVGVATVWRVLNDRGNVSPATAEKVVRAARALGLPRAVPERYRSRLRLEVLLVESEGPFFRRLSEAFLRAQAGFGDDVIVHRSFLPETEPERLAERIAAAVGTRQGIIVYAPEQPAVLAAMEQAAAAGLPVITLVTDVDCPGRLAHVGVDQHAAGRTAGFFLGALARRPGPVAIVAGRQSYRAHRQRIAGCRDVLAERYPALAPVTVVEGLDERQRTREAMLRCLDAHPDLVAVYNTASANREIGEVLTATGRAGAVVFVGHETTDATAALLRAGTMHVSIDQNPELHALRALQIVLRYARHGELKPEEAEIPFSVYCRENLRR